MLPSACRKATYFGGADNGEQTKGLRSFGRKDLAGHLEEKISPDNIVRIGELLALGALKYMCGHKMLHGMYADLARDIAYKDVEGYVLTERL